MPTAAGWGVVAAAIVVTFLGRAFATPVLFVLAASLLGALVAGLLSVNLRSPRLTADRSVRPVDPSVGRPTEVVVGVTDHGLVPAPPLVLGDPIIDAAGERLDRWLNLDRTTRLERTRHHQISYPLDTTRRGVVRLGPLEVERSDLLGLARRRRPIAGIDEVVIAAETVDITIPTGGHGDFGRRVGPVQRGIGEFGGLRAYRTGDEPRTIHWPASARTGGLKVREFVTESVRRCTVVLDTSLDSSLATPADDIGLSASRPEGPAEPDPALELLVGIAASLVAASSRDGMMTRLVTSDGHDLRGHDIDAEARRVLARIGTTDPLARIRRDPDDGRGIVIVVVRSVAAAHRLRRLIDTDISVIPADDRSPSRNDRRLVGVASLQDFVTAWQHLERSTAAR